MGLSREKVFNFIIFLNLILGLWIPFGRLNFRSSVKKKLCKFYELFHLVILISGLVIIVGGDFKINFANTNSVVFFCKLIIHTTGFIGAIFKSLVLLRNKNHLLDLIRNLNSILSNPNFKHFQTKALVKVSRFASNALILQILLFLTIQTSVFILATFSTACKDVSHKAFSNETEDTFEKALGLSKWDSTVRYLVIYNSIVASIRPFKSMAIDCLAFYFFIFVSEQICILEKSLPLACKMESGKDRISRSPFLFTSGGVLNVAAWKKFHCQIAE